MSDITQLKVAEKKLNSMISFVETIEKSGLDSAEFKEAHDFAMTTLSLDPAVDLPLPAHVSFARHKLDIRNTECLERWLDRVSTSALKKQGTVDIAEEQAAVFAERFAAMLKEKDPLERATNLQTVFSIERQYDLEEPCSSFAQAFAALLSYDQFEALGDRTELLGEALAVVDAAIPSVASRGNRLGSVLTMWPNGKKILENARAHLSKAKALRTDRRTA